MNIGENIKRIREIKRLTQEGVAKSLGPPDQLVGQA